jgi:hypothetical protein
VANARVFDVDKDVCWAWFRDIDLLVLDRASDFVDDLSPLLSWDLWAGHGVYRVKLLLEVAKVERCSEGWSRVEFENLDFLVKVLGSLK